MGGIFGILDKTKRKIKLTKKQYSHIAKKHPSVIEYLEEIKETLENPDAVTESDIDENVRFYYKYYKHHQSNQSPHSLFPLK